MRKPPLKDMLFAVLRINMVLSRHRVTTVDELERKKGVLMFLQSRMNRLEANRTRWIFSTGDVVPDMAWPISLKEVHLDVQFTEKEMNLLLNRRRMWTVQTACMFEK